MTRRLEAKTAVVTGAGSGIGRACARAMAEAGAFVVVNDLVAERAQETADLIRTDGGMAEAFAGDVTRSGFVDELVGRTVARHGRLDVMHNNAGGTQVHALITEVSDAEWDAELRLNLTSVFYGIRAAARVMVKQGGGSIVSTTSLAGLGGYIKSGPYGTAKAGIVQLTRTCAVELAGLGVRVNAVAPGTMHTEGLEEWVRSISVDLEDLQRSIPAKRLGRPEDIARAVVFLASDDAAFVHGVTLAVDGGVVGRLSGEQF